MSKIDAALLNTAVANILAFSAGNLVDPATGAKTGKVRKFIETIELQINLANYDANKDKRFNGTIRLPVAPRGDRLTVCVLGTEAHIGEAKSISIDALSVDDLKKMNKNKKLVKKMAKKYDVFLASQALIKQIPRLLGPGLNRAGKFPTPINPGETVAEKVDEARHLLKFALKKVLCLNTAVANVKMSKDDIVRNIVTAVNFLVSMLKKQWQNMGAVYVKGTMTPATQIYF